MDSGKRVYCSVLERLFLVPLKGGRWHSPSPNWQYIYIYYHLYTTYILPSGWLYATYHLLGEPETTIEICL